MFQVDCIIFCLFLKVDVEIYGDLMQVYFPKDNDISNDEDSEEAKSKDAIKINDGGKENGKKVQSKGKEWDT